MTTGAHNVLFPIHRQRSYTCLSQFVFAYTTANQRFQQQIQQL